MTSKIRNFKPSFFFCCKENVESEKANSHAHDAACHRFADDRYYGSVT